MKVVENSPQNARNCTIFKNFLGGACPQTPLAKARSFATRDMPLRGMYIPIPKNFKVGPPPPEKSCIRPCDPWRYFTCDGCAQVPYAAEVMRSLIKI